MPTDKGWWVSTLWPMLLACICAVVWDWQQAIFVFLMVFWFSWCWQCWLDGEDEDGDDDDG